MRNIFSYDSKINQILIFLTDMILLNLLYLVCCLPVLTIGAAQAGLHTGMARLLDPEDDRSVLQAFWTGLRKGFWQITGAFSILLVVLAVVLVSLWMLLVMQYAGMWAPVWMCVISGVIFILMQSVMSVFHTCFGCTVAQLFRNTFLVICANPLRSLLTALILWLPVVVAVWDTYLFLRLLPLWLAGFYSLGALLVHQIFKKPLQRLKERLMQEQS